MAVFVPWGRRRSSIFDLEHIGGLSANRTIPLLLSPQVLYALQNVALVEIADPARYATQLSDGGYYRLQPSDEDEYALFLELVSQTGLQLAEGLSVSTPLNFKEAILTQTSEANAGAGTNSLSIQGPGAEEAWFIDHITAINNTTGGTVLIVAFVTNGSTNQEIARLAPGAAGVPLIASNVHLSDDLAVVVYFFNCQAGDDLFLQISGYSMERLA